jgi:uncharacterized surface protein with fasciclin (FAS1) repeats
MKFFQIIMERPMNISNLLRSATLAFAVLATATMTSAKAADLVDTAVSAGNFSTLVAALKAADLVTTLKGKGPFTVFAPTDDAFKKLPAGELDNLLKPENKSKLAKILTYHVIAKKVMAADLAGKMLEEKTVEGGKLKIDAKGMSVKVDNATVEAADVTADNGVIHVIDTVLMPK